MLNTQLVTLECNSRLSGNIGELKSLQVYEQTAAAAKEKDKSSDAIFGICCERDSFLKRKRMLLINKTLGLSRSF